MDLPLVAKISQATSMSKKTNVKEVMFNNGYSARFSLGINSVREEWQVVWDNLTTTDKNTIDAALTSAKGVSVLKWASPTDGTIKKFITVDGWTLVPKSGNLWTITTNLRQVFDLGA